MVCEARDPPGTPLGGGELSVPSSSGWCVKLQTNIPQLDALVNFQFPLHRDGV